MNPDEIASRLFGSAQQQAEKHEVRFGEGADQDIRHYAEVGAKRILEEFPDVTPSHERFIEALAAFASLVDEMVAASERIDRYRDRYPGIIGEQTLREALNSLCPLFPIC